MLSSWFRILQAHIERALHDHFLFRKLTDSQCQVLLDCMQRVEVLPGQIVVEQVVFFLYLFFPSLFMKANRYSEIKYACQKVEKKNVDYFSIIRTNHQKYIRRQNKCKDMTAKRKSIVIMDGKYEFNMM